MISIFFIWISILICPRPYWVIVREVLIEVLQKHVEQWSLNWANQNFTHVLLLVSLTTCCNSFSNFLNFRVFSSKFNVKWISKMAIISFSDKIGENWLHIWIQHAYFMLKGHFAYKNFDIWKKIISFFSIITQLFYIEPNRLSRARNTQKTWNRNM